MHIMKVKDLPTHLAHCQFSRRFCPNDGCGLRFTEAELEDHAKVCDHAMISCQWCVFRDKRMLMNTHEAACPELPIRCPNVGCELTDLFSPSSREMKQHR